MEFCDECHARMGICRLCHEQAACKVCGEGVCTFCYLKAEEEDDDPRDGIAEGMESEDARR